MKTITKISIIAVATILLQSCNMSKHYAHMRIGHGASESMATSTNNAPTQQSTIILENSTPVITDSNIAFTSSPSEEQKQVAASSEEKPTTKIKSSFNLVKKGNSLNRTTKKTQTIRKTIKKATKKLNIRKPGSAQNEMSVDEWGYIALGLAVVAFIVLIIITGSFIAALVLAATFFMALVSLIAVGLILYAIWAVFNFLSGGF